MTTKIPSSTSAPIPAPVVLDDYATDRLDYRIRQLQLQFTLSEEDLEDLRGDMVLELVKAFKRFNPTKAKRETFINRVLDRFLPLFMRRQCTKQRRPWENALGFEDVSPGFQAWGNEPAQGEFSEQEFVDLRMDIDMVLERMSPDDQRTALQLMVYSRAEVARRIGVHRCSMSRIVERIRQHFIDAGLDIWVETRNTSAPGADVEGAPKKDEVTE